MTSSPPSSSSGGTSLVAELTLGDLTTSFEVRTLQGVEGLSRAFELELEFVSTDTALDLASLVGARAELTLAHGSHERTIVGIAAQLGQGATSASQATYRALLVPPMWRLTKRKDSRVFQGMTTIAIVEQVLGAYGFSSVSDYTVPTSASTTRDLCVQYQETDWDFVNRLLEEEGIYFYFEHDDGSCRMVMTDDGAIHTSLGTVDYAEDAQALTGDAEAVTSFETTHQVVTPQVTTWSVQTTTPLTTTVEEAKADAAVSSFVETFDYQPEQSATHQLEVELAGAAVAAGTVSSVRFAAGVKVTLQNHPRADLDATYLITEVTHDLELVDASRYEATIRCLDERVSYRPARVTARPSIHGPQPATVVGRDGVEVDTDAYGRVLVRMQWDRNCTQDGSSSVAGTYDLWVHVAQMASGSMGSMFIPRAGSYVLVEFLGGDPDRPVITGRMYSDTTQPPYVLPTHATKSTIRSKIFGVSDEYSEITFDDAASAKQLYVRAQRELKVDVGTSTETDVRHELTVHGDEEHIVAGGQDLNVQGDRLVVIGAAKGDTAAAVAHDVKIVGDQQHVITGSDTTSVGGDRTATVTGDDTRVVGGDRSVAVTGSELATFSTDRTTVVGTSGTTASTTDTLVYTDDTTVHGNQSLYVDGAQYVEVTGNRQDTVAGNLDQQVDGKLTVTATSLETAVTNDVALASTSGEVLIESASDAVKVAGNTVYIAADAQIELRSTTSITLSVGSLTDDSSVSCQIKLDSSGITITNGTVTTKLDGDLIKLNT